MTKARGGERAGAGRPRGQGRYGEETTSVRIPRTLVPEVNRLLAAHAEKVPKTVNTSSETCAALVTKIERQLLASPVISLKADAIALLKACGQLKEPPRVVHLDPWYWSSYAGKRRTDLAFWLRLIEAARHYTNHILLWGSWRYLFEVIPMLPPEFEVKHCVVWHFQNSPSRGGGWRTSHNHCLHILRKGIKVSPVRFLNAAQLERHREGTLRFYPAPPDVIVEPLQIGYINRPAQTGHPAQKPARVISELLKMVTTPGELIVDPTAGSGTVGAVAPELELRAILGDHNREYVAMTKRRLALD